MSHLSKEQFEDILAGNVQPPRHLESCNRCRARLQSHLALKNGLKSTFDDVNPPAQLSNRLHMICADAHGSEKSLHPGRKTLKSAAGALAVAASLLLVVVILASSLTPAAAQASPAQLARIHDMNLTGHDEFYTHSDPAELSAFFRSKLGFDPHLPRPGRGLKLRGCCISLFGDSVAGSYVVDTPDGNISVVVVTESPGKIGMHKVSSKSAEQLWRSEFAGNRMVATRRGIFTYCAVGQTDYKVLTELLQDLTHP